MSMSSTKKYVQKFRKSWLDRDELKEWLVENPNAGPNARYGGYCVYCNTALPSKLYDLQSHAASRKHARNVSEKTRIEVKLEKKEHIFVDANHSCHKLSIVESPDPHEVLELEQLANVPMEETKEDIFGRYVASELKSIKNQKIYEEVKWDILQALEDAIRQQLDLEESEA